MTEEKTIKLPSMGKVGGISEVTIRGMKGADEKVLYSGVSEQAMDKLLKRCIVEPSDINVSELCEQDKYFILVQIRILTFGSMYRFEAECTNKKCQEDMIVELDLDDLEVFYADDNFDKSLHTKLPCGDEIDFKILTTRDINETNNTIAKLKKQNDKGTQLILRQASFIDKVNGKSMSLLQKQAYLEDLSSRDCGAIWNAYKRIQLGVNLETVTTCPHCNKVLNVPVVMNSEFFRPTDDYNDASED